MIYLYNYLFYIILIFCYNIPNMVCPSPDEWGGPYMNTFIIVLGIILTLLKITETLINIHIKLKG
ncbi:hypothetical protein AN2V17_34100 [Vallitalea sp. AN17-2]|uniref:Uncharacterized protein n=1 Tax=Vallitalea maricola TaxID=3074433 RepID=A0ACB5UNS5_9FIRM|nr:hypothetical protein AN2V17_34100 [Vallitalea sp. AN17-2]